MHPLEDWRCARQLVHALAPLHTLLHKADGARPSLAPDAPPLGLDPFIHPYPRPSHMPCSPSFKTIHTGLWQPNLALIPTSAPRVTSATFPYCSATDLDPCPSPCPHVHPRALWPTTLPSQSLRVPNLSNLFLIHAPIPNLHGNLAWPCFSEIIQARSLLHTGTISASALPQLLLMGVTRL